MFEQYGVAAVTKADVRPDAKPDVLVDICEMPEIESSSYDIVFASYVLTCVHSLDTALAEFSRILTPEGHFYSSDPIGPGETVEHTDSDRISSWYGRKALQEYNVGSFRTLGQVGVRRSLSEWFDVDAMCAEDPVTGTVAWWHIATKRMA